MKKNLKPISDFGYFGAAGITMPNKKPKGKDLTGEQNQFNNELAKKRIKVEHTIGKIIPIQSGQITAQRYRNALTKHSLILRTLSACIT